MIVNETTPPPVHAYMDFWERGLDPWHADAFPSEHKSVGTAGPRAAGWYAIDYCGNAIGFVADGTDVDDRTSEARALIVLGYIP